MRDDFPQRIKDQLAKRVGYRCSRPECRQLTSGPSLSTPKAINMGVAAHITAASPGGARYDPSPNSEQRKSYDNGIWLCKHCADLVDKDAETYPVELLRDWKESSEHSAGQEAHRLPQIVQDEIPPSEQQGHRLQSLPQKLEVEDLKNANLRVELSPCLDARSAHEQWGDFPDPTNVKPSSHFYVAHNERLLGTAFSGNPDDWCFCFVSLKKDQEDVDAYSKIILRLALRQDDQKWVFYGHKVLAQLESQSKGVCSSPPYYQDYEISAIKPRCTKVGVIRFKKEPELTDDLDRFFKYQLFYRVRDALVLLKEEMIPIDPILRD
ncbi:hypothetical protein ACFL2Q_05210 [Thermodesulfobacteriota bacterium]